MTANFVDVMLIDADTVSFLLNVVPNLRWNVLAAAVVVVPLLILLWHFDPYRIRRRIALAGALASFAALAALSLASPIDRDRAFMSIDYVSHFARSGAAAAIDLAVDGLLQSDASAAPSLPLGDSPACEPGRKPPHIIMVLDESSFDISALPTVKTGPDYGAHFRSLDGKSRSLLVEGAGGPTWYTEYNVLTGLSARSYGRFAEFVTRIAAGRVSRSLPGVLRDCGYRTFSLYPWYGFFLNANRFQKTLRVEHFLDLNDFGNAGIEPDSFYYKFAADLIARERHKAPMFVFTYLMANHFPWDYRFRPDLAADWRDPGNREVNGHRVDEYLRRQHMSARDYQSFLARLRTDFPQERFLIVRFGDHQPFFAKSMVEQNLTDSAVGRLIDAGDPRFFTTYYAIDAVNFTPADMGSALDRLDAPYLPIVVLEAAGLPLDASFAEQKRVMQRCGGLFFRCNNGAEVRRFNRLLIDAGLIKGL
jgi:phosphoglycerol transferase MdoB-like AlkP superfamily enzyme